MKEFKLPSLGENITHGDVIRVLVAKGDHVRVQQTVIELETDKALIEVPCEYAGTVTKVLVSPGDRIEVGQTILQIEEGGEKAAQAAQPAPAPKAAEPPAAAGPSQAKQAAAPAKREAGVKTAAAQDQRAVETPAPPADGAAAETAQQTDGARGRYGANGAKPTVTLQPAPPDAQQFNATDITAAAGPATRRMARELGVDLARVPGSGRGGRVTGDDVREYVRRSMLGHAAAATPAAGAELPDFSQWGEISFEPLNAVRRKTAEHLGASWLSVPLVTQFESADITDLEAMRQRFKPEAEERGVHLTTTVLLLKALLPALKAYPRFNSSLDVRQQQLVYKRYYHIGIATDTERGLLVPVLRDVDKKDLWQLAAELAELTDRARQAKLELSELRGASFTLSNQGGIGGGFFTPLVSHPEVAILGVGQARTEPVWAAPQDRFVPRLILPLALSYDHRVVDGADAARFVTQLKRSLEDPQRLLLGL